MKNIIDCKDEKITEKAFSHHLLVSILSILLCIVALCSITYAWFTSETQSGNNTLTAGSFDVTISVVRLDENGAEAGELDVVADPARTGVYTCQLDAKGTYRVTLNLTKESNAKGHCLVAVGKDSAKHTAAIIGDQTKNCENMEKSDPFTFTVEVQESTTVTLEPRWGMVVEPDIVNKGAYPVSGATQEEQQ